MMTTPTDRMNGFAATEGKESSAAASTTTPRSFSAVERREPPSRPVVVPGSGAVTDVVSEALGKTTSEESLRPHHQGGEQRDVEERLGPRRPERDLEQGLAHAQHHRGDRRSRDAAQSADDDDRHQRADPVPVQRRVERGVEGERGAADGGGGEAQ